MSHRSYNTWDGRFSPTGSQRSYKSGSSTTVSHTSTRPEYYYQKESSTRLATKYKNWTPHHLAAHIKSLLTYGYKAGRFPQLDIYQVAAWVVDVKLAGRAFYDLGQEDIEEMGVAAEWKEILLFVWRHLHQIPSKSGSQSGSDYSSDSGSIRNPAFWRKQIPPFPPPKNVQDSSTRDNYPGGSPTSPPKGVIDYNAVLRLSDVSPLRVDYYLDSPTRTELASSAWSPVPQNLPLPVSPRSSEYGSYSSSQSVQSILPSSGPMTPSAEPETPLQSVIISAAPPAYQSLFSPVGSNSLYSFSDTRSISGGTDRSSASYASYSSTSMVTAKKSEQSFPVVEEEINADEQTEEPINPTKAMTETGLTVITTSPPKEPTIPIEEALSFIEQTGISTEEAELPAAEEKSNFTSNEDTGETDEADTAPVDDLVEYQLDAERTDTARKLQEDADIVEHSNLPNFETKILLEEENLSKLPEVKPKAEDGNTYSIDQAEISPELRLPVEDGHQTKSNEHLDATAARESDINDKPSAKEIETDDENTPQTKHETIGNDFNDFNEADEHSRQDDAVRSIPEFQGIGAGESENEVRDAPNEPGTSPFEGLEAVSTVVASTGDEEKSSESPAVISNDNRPSQQAGPSEQVHSKELIGEAKSPPPAEGKGPKQFDEPLTAVSTQEAVAESKSDNPSVIEAITSSEGVTANSAGREPASADVPPPQSEPHDEVAVKNVEVLQCGQDVETEGISKSPSPDVKTASLTSNESPESSSDRSKLSEANHHISAARSIPALDPLQNIGPPSDHSPPLNNPASPPAENMSCASDDESLSEQKTAPVLATSFLSSSHLAPLRNFNISEVDIQVVSATDGQSEVWDGMISQSGEEGDDEDPDYLPPPTAGAATVTSTWASTTEPSTRRTVNANYPMAVDAERIEAILQATMSQISRLTQRIEGLEDRLSKVEAMLRTEAPHERVQISSSFGAIQGSTPQFNTEIYGNSLEPFYLRLGALLVGLSVMMGATHLARRGLV